MDDNRYLIWYLIEVNKDDGEFCLGSLQKHVAHIGILKSGPFHYSWKVWKANKAETDAVLEMMKEKGDIKAFCCEVTPCRSLKK